MQPETLKSETETVAAEEQTQTEVDTIVATDTPVTPAEEPVVVAAPKAKKRTLILAVAIIVVSAAAAAGVYWYTVLRVEPVAMVGGVDYPAVVAVVNGQEISVAEFQQSYDQAAAVAVQQGFDPATSEEVRAEVEKQALTVLVNTVLMKQKALEAGFVATDEAINEQVATLETQFGGAEQLATALAGAGLDDTAMRDDLKDQIIIDQFIKASPEWQAIAVSDEDVRAFYDSVAATTEGIPPFEDVAEEARAQLESQKQQEATAAIIERIRTESEIEVKI